MKNKNDQYSIKKKKNVNQYGYELKARKTWKKNEIDQQDKKK